MYLQCIIIRRDGTYTRHKTGIMHFTYLIQVPRCIRTEMPGTTVSNFEIIYFFLYRVSKKNGAVQNATLHVS